MGIGILEPWSVRSVASDITLSTSKTSSSPTSFTIPKGDYITVPHDLHMRDPQYFNDPETFNPERFLVHNSDGSLSTDMGTIRPYGGGPSMCKGRVFAERECLALVAGVLVMWDFQPVSGDWTIPALKKTSAVSLPEHDTRARVKRRKFEWDTT